MEFDYVLRVNIIPKSETLDTLLMFEVENKVEEVINGPVSGVGDREYDIISQSAAFSRCTEGHLEGRLARQWRIKRLYSDSMRLVPWL